MNNGIGIWVFSISECERGDVQHIIRRAVDSGIGWIAIKSGDAYRNNQWQPEAARSFIEACHAQDIQVFSWNGSRPQTWPAEVKLISSLLEDGVDGHIVDCTVDWSGFQAEAERFMAQLRDTVGQDPFIAYTAPPQYNMAGQYPWAAFGKACDAVMPMTRWTDGNNSMKVTCDLMDRGMEDMARVYPEAVKPIYPVGVAYGRGNGNVSKGLLNIQDVEDFVTRYRGQYPSLYSWDASKHFPNVFMRLSKMNESGSLSQDEAASTASADMASVDVEPIDKTPELQAIAELINSKIKSGEEE